MKVLFAVSNEEISESIVKKYQKEYKQIISYKNVYYFNAILKELQKDKTYDRVVISEDLEAFTHTQYDQIDKFIFEKLDSISDEASNTRGNDIPIILICSDRRVKSEEMLVKLFGIGVYNAIIGSDRSVDEVCRLINRPRAKKDAKIYYKIDSENVNYQSENENDVSEMEIQNILAHYKRLGKNEDRYIDSFNNIAAQYNDTQLRIISKFLPLNVRAVLEEKSPKYQQIMSFNNSVSDTLRKPKKEVEEGPSETLLVSKTKDRIMSRPVVIPSSINMNSTKKLARVKAPEQPVKLNKNTSESYEEPIQQLSTQSTTQQAPIQFETYDRQSQQLPVEPVKRGRGRPRKNPISTTEEPVVATKRKRGRPRKNPIPEEVAPIIPMEIEEEEPTILPGFEEPQETILPGFEEPQETTLPSFEEPQETILPGFEEPKREESGFLPGVDYAESSKSEEVFTSGANRENEFYHNQNQSNAQYGVQKNQDTILPGFERQPQQEQEMIDLSPLLTPDKKIVTFVGTSKNGTSFIVNNLAQLLSSNGVNTAILDTTQNRNSYYIYTKNEEDLREIATHSMDSLANGVARGILVNKNLTVYTSLPNEGEAISNVSKVLETLLKNHSLILIDTDFKTPLGYFEQSQETYLVQTLDILTIQPLTAFLRELKSRNILDEKKLRVILNKTVKIRGISDKTIIGGMAYYNDPAMSFMTELFDRNLMRYVSIPFEEETYIKYLENIIECEISLKGYSKVFMQTLKELSNMVYPLTNTYRPPTASGYGKNNNFTPSMNNTLNQMKNNY
jgi:hypothetical protein